MVFKCLNEESFVRVSECLDTLIGKDGGVATGAGRGPTQGGPGHSDSNLLSQRELGLQVEEERSYTYI